MKTFDNKIDIRHIVVQEDNKIKSFKQVIKCMCNFLTENTIFGGFLIPIHFEQYDNNDREPLTLIDLNTNEKIHYVLHCAIKYVLSDFWHKVSHLLT